jgi:hypothetical protein
VLLRNSWIVERELAFEGVLTFSVLYRGLVGLGLSPISWGTSVTSFARSSPNRGSTASAELEVGLQPSVWNL